MANRPKFREAWQAFETVNVPVKMVGDLIGDKVKLNIDNGIFNNACPIRISYVLNQTGFKITKKQNIAMSSGRDGQWHLYRVVGAIEYLQSTFGQPEVIIKGAPSYADFKDKKGILAVKGTGWGDARGHITLWNGTKCSGSCHLSESPDNGTFVPEEAYLWELP